MVSIKALPYVRMVWSRVSATNGSLGLQQWLFWLKMKNNQLMFLNVDIITNADFSSLSFFFRNNNELLQYNDTKR